MKINKKQFKFFIFCVLNILAINIGVAQDASLDNIEIKDSLQIKKNDKILETPFGIFNLSNTTGSVFRISGDELRKTVGDNLINALRGKVPGLRIVRSNNSPVNGGSYTYTLNGRTPSVLIDGQPRGLQVDLREVEEVIILTDATFNSLLGNLGDNGLIYVITKGGKASKPIVEVNYQRTLNTIATTPKHLSAAEYATVLNKASNNDGFGDIYSQEAIDAYQNGTDPVLYPNVNAQETFLEDSSAANFMSLNVYGGDNNVNYSGFVSYSDWKGLEKVGEKTDGRNITFRTKIKAKLNDVVTTHGSVYGQFGRNKRNVLTSDQTIQWINNTPANAFPLNVGDSAYVVSNQYQGNLLAELEKGGTRTDYSSNMIFDVGLDFDLNKYIKGLKYSTYGMIRTNNNHSLVTNNAPELLLLDIQKDINNLDSIAGYKIYQDEDIKTSPSRNTAVIGRYFSYGGNLSYVKENNDGILNLNLSHLLYYNPSSGGTNADQRNLTFNLNSSYVLKDKYILYANANSSSSSKFIGENRTKIFPTLGVAWVASNEDFLKNNKVIDYLKFRTSYGVVGTEYDGSSLLYLDRWSGGRNSGTTYNGANNTQDDYGYSLAATGNQEIDWVLYNQLFAGVELQLLKKFTLNVNYFNIEIQNQTTNASALYADALGENVYLPQLNFTTSKNVGFNANLTYRDNVGSFKYYANVNVGHNKVVGEKLAEVQYPDQYRLKQGQAQDVITGYVSDGLFTAANIDTALPQFTDVKVGDIRYVDQNGDNVIDSRDQRTIGNSNPRYNYGINVGFEYKGINLDIVGTGVTGYEINLNSYYRHNGSANYFGSVNSDLPNGNANPRLSTLSNSNNYVNSDYWLADGTHFRISNVELGYSLPKSTVSNSVFSDVKFFIRGNNLAVFSKFSDLDPEDLNAGISKYPMLRTFALGASINF